MRRTPLAIGVATAMAAGALALSAIDSHNQPPRPTTPNVVYDYTTPVSANDSYDVRRLPALKPCESKAGAYPHPCVWDRTRTKGENKGPTFWAVGTGKDNRFEADTVAEANAAWRDPAEWLSIDAETAGLLREYAEPGQEYRDWTRCGQRIFYGNDSPSIIACPDGYIEKD